MAGMKLRVVVVDDEPLARQRLKRLLAGSALATVVGEAGDGLTAVARIDHTHPDVVLLDVEMPELDGFEVVAQLARPRPLVIFLTAFDRYALQAFEIHAIDYLLKPVSRERLADALAHARERQASRSDDRDAALASAIESLSARRSKITRLPVRSEGRVELVDVSTIDWIEAANNYVVLHAGGKTHVLRETLARLEQRLSAEDFVRIHRSTIVRLDRVVRLDSASRGDYDVTLRDGTRLTLSRTCRSRLERAVRSEIWPARGTPGS
jgi:two-component system LytT family response regulator